MRSTIINSIFLTLFVFFLLIAGWYWLERVGVMKTSVMVTFLSSVLGRSDTDIELSLSKDVLLLDKLRLEKKQNRIQQLELEVLRQAQELDNREYLLEQEVNAIENTRNTLEEQQKNINQILKQNENKNERVLQVAESLINMPPQNAVDILVVFDDDLLIDTLNAVNTIADENGTTSVVPFWLSLMESTRAGEVQKKIVNK